jgi:uncharacterized damage-inducible protein DinB
MPIVESLVPEFDHEMGTTRRVLDRVPEDEFAWRPHEKSMTLGQLAGHLANLPYWGRMILEGTSYDLSAPGNERRNAPPASRVALVQEFDDKVAAARAVLVKMTDPELMVYWTLKHGDHEVFTMPRISVVRGFFLNHSIHHRGQLTVYLRLKNVPLPPIYGPTADEQ